MPDKQTVAQSPLPRPSYILPGWGYIVSVRTLGHRFSEKDHRVHIYFCWVAEVTASAVVWKQTLAEEDDGVQWIRYARESRCVDGGDPGLLASCMAVFHDSEGSPVAEPLGSRGRTERCQCLDSDQVPIHALLVLDFSLPASLNRRERGGGVYLTTQSSRLRFPC